MPELNTLVIGGVKIPLQTRFDLNETREDIGGTSSFRTLNGKLKKQTHWEGFAFNISGGGLMPAPIREIDKTVPTVLDSINPMSFRTQLTSFTIPRTIRPDVEPFVLAILDNSDDVVETPSSRLGQVLTITPVPGATDYIVQAYLRFDVMILEINENLDVNSKDFGWSISCEEVL